ncbi:hypothetical protein CVT24_012849 [Panaeolus cyanescens]|uniref:Uncharacterized protein n=1 Tax=Panaeolus cyanescens TaxID=181874 RepID=A0A409WKV7_9AGAR|nr:hypothetical protein CVT24_012849 [Panaeolus cyanescens]
MYRLYWSYRTFVPRNLYTFDDVDPVTAASMSMHCNVSSESPAAVTLSADEAIEDEPLSSGSESPCASPDLSEGSSEGHRVDSLPRVSPGLTEDTLEGCESSCVSYASTEGIPENRPLIRDRKNACVKGGTIFWFEIESEEPVNHPPEELTPEVCDRDIFLNWVASVAKYQVWRWCDHDSDGSDGCWKAMRWGELGREDKECLSALPTSDSLYFVITSTGLPSIVKQGTWLRSYINATGCTL